MSNILKLMLLDKALLKPYYKYFLVISIIPAIMILQYKAIIPSIIFVTCMIAMTSNYTFSVTEKNDLNRLYGLLPVSKKEIVTGRYIFTALIGLVTIFISVIFNLIVLTIIKIPITIDEVISSIGVGIITYFLFTAIQLPGFFKLGAIKGRFFSFVPFIGMFLMAYIADKISPTWVSKASSLAILNNPFAMLIIAILSAIVFYGISIGITQRIYDSMEL